MNGSKELLPYVRLRFNVAHPSLEECYSYGYECALAKIEESSNPYKEGTKEHDYWGDGWWAGFYGVEAEFETITSKEKAQELNDLDENFEELELSDNEALEKINRAKGKVKVFTTGARPANPSSYRFVATWINNSFVKTLKITGVVAAAMIIVFQLLPFAD